MQRATVIISLSLSLVSGGLPAVAGTPLGDEVTYQGHLRTADGPVNDTADFDFSLWDAAVDGTMIGSVIAVDGVGVVDGLFTVELDFDAGSFNGEARWLEIAVQSPTGTGELTTLSPRQPLTAAPFAMYALDGPGSGESPWQPSGADVFYDAGRVGVGEPNPLAPLHVQLTDLGVDASMLGANTVGVLEGTDTILRLFANGGGLTGAAITLQEIDGGVLSDSWTIRRRTSFDGSGLDIGHSDGRVMRMLPTGHVGIGTDSPNAPLHVQGDDSTPELIIGGTGSGSEPTLWFHEVDNGWNLRHRGADNSLRFSNTLGGADHVTIQDDGDVGIGTTSPAATLHVASGTDTSPGGGGHLVIGSTSGLNISFDNNEIMARDNGAGSTLHLNHEGGDVLIGANGDGNVGIGTTAPAADLHVRGDSATGELLVTPGISDSDAQIRMTENTSASLGAIMRYDGSSNEWQVLGRNTDGEQGPHLTVGRDNGRVEVAQDLVVNGAVRTPERTHSRIISPIAFVTAFDARLDGTGFGMALVLEGSSADAFAQLALPDGATITAISARVYDTSDTRDIEIGLGHQAVGAPAEEIAWESSSGAPGLTLVEFTGSFTLDMENSAYYLRYRGGNPGSGALFGLEVEVAYTTSTIE